MFTKYQIASFFAGFLAGLLLLNISIRIIKKEWLPVILMSRNVSSITSNVCKSRCVCKELKKHTTAYDILEADRICKPYKGVRSISMYSDGLVIYCNGGFSVSEYTYDDSIYCIKGVQNKKLLLKGMK